MNEEKVLEQMTPKQKAVAAPDRKPIRIERLMFRADKPTMQGIRIPQGDNSKGEEQKHDLLAGVYGQDKVEIEYRPWVRAFRIARFRKQTKTGPKGEIESWEPWGKPFYVSETWAVWIPVEDV